MDKSTGSLSTGSIASPMSIASSEATVLSPLMLTVRNCPKETVSNIKTSSRRASRKSQNASAKLRHNNNQSADRRKRLAANARERKRMHLLNKAYDVLRQRLVDAENKSKYDVLVQAKEYIQALAKICENFDRQNGSLSMVRPLEKIDIKLEQDDCCSQLSISPALTSSSSQMAGSTQSASNQLEASPSPSALEFHDQFYDTVANQHQTKERQQCDAPQQSHCLSTSMRQMKAIHQVKQEFEHFEKLKSSPANTMATNQALLFNPKHIYSYHHHFFNQIQQQRTQYQHNHQSYYALDTRAQAATR